MKRSAFDTLSFFEFHSSPILSFSFVKYLFQPNDSAAISNRIASSNPALIEKFFRPPFRQFYRTEKAHRLINKVKECFAGDETGRAMKFFSLKSNMSYNAFHYENLIEFE